MIAVNVLSASVTDVRAVEHARDVEVRRHHRRVGRRARSARAEIAILPELHPDGRRRNSASGERIEIRIERGAAAVHAVEVERRRPHVVDRRRVLRASMVDETSSVMSWSTNWPKYV